MVEHDMQRYADFAPTGSDIRGLNADRVGADWFVLVAQNRDSDCLELSNFRSCERALQRVDADGCDHQVHRFGHWACGWFELILVRPETPAEEEAGHIHNALRDYPVVDESDFSDLEHESAQTMWSECMSQSERVQYIRDHRCQFEFSSFADMLACARGHYFKGYASELLSP